MRYDHNIFISYAHGQMWTKWVSEKFVPRLEAYLEAELGPSKISLDDQIAPGALWEQNLCRRLARSKIMISLLTANYFHRSWCRREMALMFQRERSLNMEGRDVNYGLLIPVRLGDGDTFPNYIKRVQYIDFEEYADPDLPQGTERASRFNDRVKSLAKVICHTLNKVPNECSPDWIDFNGGDFIRKLRPKVAPRSKPSRLLI